MTSWQYDIDPVTSRSVVCNGPINSREEIVSVFAFVDYQSALTSLIHRINVRLRLN
jgi:hypothetical protein